MAAGGVGHWHARHWHIRHWHPRHWVEAGAVGPIAALRKLAGFIVKMGRLGVR